MRPKLLLALIPMTLVTACASFYPDLVTLQPVTPAAPSTTPEVDQILAQAAALQAKYASGYKQTAKFQDYSQFPLIGAATAAAVVLLHGKSSAAMTAGDIGIGAGAYSAGRGQLFSPGLTDAYVAGHGALTCVIAEGSYFSGQRAGNNFDQLQVELQEVANAIYDAQQAERLDLTPAAAADVEALKTARSLAEAAVTQARAAETAGRAQQAAFEDAAPIFRNAVASISVRVVSKGRVRPAAQSFDALRDSLAPPKAPETGAAHGLTNDVPTVIRDIVAKTNGLIAVTGQLNAATPRYKESLARVEACPDQIH